MKERIEIGEVSVLKKVNDVIMAIIKVVLIVFGTVMTCLVIMNVILRYVFNSGLSWSEEASRFLFIWVTFLGAILANDAGLHGEHMRMDFIVEKIHGVPRKIVELIAEGLDNKAIASALFVSEGTVRNHISDILSKLNLKNRTQLAIHYWKSKMKTNNS